MQTSQHIIVAIGLGCAIGAITLMPTKLDRALRTLRNAPAPMKPLPALLAPISTWQGAFVRPMRPASGSTPYASAKECTYLATDYSTSSGEVLRLIHGVNGDAYIYRGLIAAMFAAGSAEYILEYRVHTSAEGRRHHTLHRYHPGPGPHTATLSYIDSDEPWWHFNKGIIARDVPQETPHA